MNATLGLSPSTQDLCRRLHTPRGSFQFQPAAPSFLEKRRIRINVRGFQFETFQATLEQFPDTMLGSPIRRYQFYDPVKDQYFLDRDPAVFDFILFFYQSNGIISRPETIPITVFNEELKFFGITTNHQEELHEPESPTQEEETTLTCSQRTRKLRKNCWVVMEYPRSSLAGKIWGRISITVIVLSVIAFCLETMPELNCPKESANASNGRTNQSRLIIESHGTLQSEANETSSINQEICSAARIWFVVETTVVVFFLVEYLMRIYSAPNRCTFVLSILGIVDLAAIAPYFITLAVYGRRTKMYQQVTSFSVLRIIRLCRVLRVLKLSRYSNGLKLVGKTFSNTWRTLSSLMLCVLMTVVLFSSFQFFTEERESIPAYFYWAIVTMTTVGYGDVVPITLLGKLSASACMFLGIVLLFILPLPVFVTHFSTLYEEEVDRRKHGQRKVAYESPMLLEQLMAPPARNK